MYTLRSPARPTWQQLYNQFGSGYSRLRDFRDAFLGSLKAVKEVYSDVRVDYTENGLVLLPSPTPVAPAKVHLVSG
jgi:hypothetical protein